MSEQPSAEQIKQQCIFCHIIAGDVAAKKVYEDEQVMAVLDINPASTGHILLLTKEHYSIMPQLPDNLIGHLGQVSKALSLVLLKALNTEGTTIFIANGPAAGQRAQHFMLHIIPRKKDDNVGLQMGEGIHLNSQQLAQLKQVLVSAIKKTFDYDQPIEMPVQENKKITAPNLDDIAALLK